MHRMIGVFLLLSSLCCAGEDPVTETRSLLEEQITAWNRGDLEAFCTLYAEDALFVSPSGITEGREAVLARYRKRYPDRAAMGSLSIEIRETRAHADGRVVALAGIWTLTYPDRDPLQGQTLVVLERREQGWRIVHDASM
jgi:uncharacterized protein (TIGR02246 family)